MAQQIDLVARFLALIDAVYKVESLTARLDTLTRDVPFSGANEVKVMKLSTVGLGTYSRAAGYPAGDITATWETMQLTAERGRAFSLDRMDNEETLGLVREVHDASRPSFNLARRADAVEWLEGYHRLDPQPRPLLARAPPSSTGAENNKTTLTKVVSLGRPVGRMMVPHGGFEPPISALRGRCPRPLDECGTSP